MHRLIIIKSRLRLQKMRHKQKSVCELSVRMAFWVFEWHSERLNGILNVWMAFWVFEWHSEFEQHSECSNGILFEWHSECLNGILSVWMAFCVFEWHSYYFIIYLYIIILLSELSHSSYNIQLVCFFIVRQVKNFLFYPLLPSKC
jgi:F0F1-type ATP synthase assembly protein I